MATILSKVTTGVGSGLSKAWAWLKAHPKVALVLVGFLLGALATGFWDRRHPVVKIEEHTVTDTTAVKAVQDKLDFQIQKNYALTQDLAIAQNTIVDLQTKKTTHTHVEKKPDGSVITDTTTETDTNKKTDSTTKTDEKTNVADNTKVDESSLHNSTETDKTHTDTTKITTPMVAPRLLLTGGGGLQFGNGFNSAWAAGAGFHAGTFLGMDLYPGAMYFSPGNTVLLTFTLGVFH